MSNTPATSSQDQPQMHEVKHAINIIEKSPTSASHDDRRNSVPIFAYPHDWVSAALYLQSLVDLDKDPDARQETR